MQRPNLLYTNSHRRQLTIDKKFTGAGNEQSTNSYSVRLPKTRLQPDEASELTWQQEERAGPLRRRRDPKNQPLKPKESPVETPHRSLQRQYQSSPSLKTLSSGEIERENRSMPLSPKTRPSAAIDASEPRRGATTSRDVTGAVGPRAQLHSGEKP